WLASSPLLPGRYPARVIHPAGYVRPFGSHGRDQKGEIPLRLSHDLPEVTKEGPGLRRRSPLQSRPPLRVPRREGSIPVGGEYPLLHACGLFVFEYRGFCQRQRTSWRSHVHLAEKWQFHNRSRRPSEEQWRARTPQTSWRFFLPVPPHWGVR